MRIKSKNEGIYETYSWFTLLYSRNEHNIVKQLWKVKVKSLSPVQLFATPWTIAYQASPSMGFSRQEYRRSLPFPSPEDLPDPGIKPGSPALWQILYHLSHISIKLIKNNKESYIKLSSCQILSSVFRLQFFPLT